MSAVSRFGHVGLAALAFLLLMYTCAPAANAATVFSVSGPNTSDALSTTILIQSSHLGFGVEFTTATNYSNVSFSVTLADTLGVPSTVGLEVFLTSQIGPGTTSSSEIASATPTVNVVNGGTSAPYNLSQVDILSLPFLPAGTYYLTFDATSVSDGSPKIVESLDAQRIVATLPGVTVDPTLDTGGPAAYLPASGFGLLDGVSSWFAMTGDPASVPEPSTLLISLSGIAVVVGASRRKGLNRKG